MPHGTRRDHRPWGVVRDVMWAWANGGARRPARLVTVVLSAVLISGAGAPPAPATVSELNGSAYGAFVKVGLFGGPPTQVGAAPAVVLPPGGGKEARSLPELVAQFGPATIFGGRFEEQASKPSGELRASTEGRTGPGAFVTSSASVVDVGPGPLIASGMSSTCRAEEGGVTGSVKVTEGIVETSYNAETQLPATTVDIPADPRPNTVVEGTIDHVGDRFRVVFNEQIVDGDTIIVRAAHMYLLGDVAVGDLIVAQSVCGLSAGDASTAPPTMVPVEATGTALADEAATTGGPGSELDARSTSSEPDGDRGSAPLLVALA
ncbi:MAG: hypothetical protein M3Q48_06285, partial [Actinomycetota bacterium]|nr:hypothetical protein [Actinomycetota bacterium]